MLISRFRQFRGLYLDSNETPNARINPAGNIEPSIQFSRMTIKLHRLGLNELLCCGLGVVAQIAAEAVRLLVSMRDQKNQTSVPHPQLAAL